MCDGLFNEFSQHMADPGVSLGRVERDKVEIVGHARSGSFWRGLHIGEAVLSLELFHWGGFEPPRSLEVLKRQPDWPCSLSIEYPAVSINGFAVRSEYYRHPDTAHYEIQSGSDNSGPELHAYTGTTESLLQATGAENVHDLWDALEDAIWITTPTAWSTGGRYQITTSKRGPQRTVRLTGEEQYSQVHTPGGGKTHREFEIALSGTLQFMASWACPTVSHDSSIQIQYSTADRQPDGTSLVVPRAEFGSADGALVEKVGYSVLRQWAQHLLVV